MYLGKVIRRASDATPTGRADSRSAVSGHAIKEDIKARLSGELSDRKGLSVVMDKTIETWVSAEVRWAGGSGDPGAFAAQAAAVLRGVVKDIPRERDDGVLHVEVPLVTRVPAGDVIQDVVVTLVKLHGDGQRQLGGKIADIVVKNLLRVSKLTEQQAREKPHRLKFPKDITATDTDLVTMFLGGTVLGDLLLSPVAVTITDRTRLSHGLCVAQSGYGKTMLVGALIAAELSRPRGQETGLVILDSQSDLMNKIKRLKAVSDNGRLLLVDAGDSAGMALNLFDWGTAGSHAGSLVEQEQALMARIELTEYVLTGLFGSDMTVRQSTMFRYLIQLMMNIGGTLETLRQCLETPEMFRNDMEKLDGLARDYLLNQFMSKAFAPVRKQVLQRLYAVLQSKVFARMFTAKHNRLNIGKALNEGRIVVVNTNKAVLQEQAKVFGRFMIALIMRAAFDRAKIPEANRRPSYCLIDEAADYFDSDDKNLQTLLEQARKYGIGCTIFLQSLSQMSPSLRSAVLSNTTIKLAGGVSSKDAKMLAAEMQCLDEFILSQRKDAEGASFATYVKSLTPRAISWRVPFMQLERLPQMSEADFQYLLARNRRELND